MSDPDLYTIAWISALSIERVAAKAFLDEELPRLDDQDKNDHNTYTLGRIGRHYVVIAVLPEGIYGTSSAAAVAKDLIRTFKNIRLGILVGIGGGAPTSKNDIRLGDVVVSTPSAGTGGVYQYDYGKSHQDRAFEQTGFLNSPPISLLGAVSTLKGDHESDGHQIQDAIAEALHSRPRLKKAGYSRPDSSSDCLFKSDVVHEAQGEACSDNCLKSDQERVHRLPRADEDDDPAIFYGVIASANQLMKDAVVRDRLAAEKGVLCFEMEAAGLVNSFGFLVVRGICDYADSHKADAWQKYAAMTAAAYTKELISRIVPSQVEAEERIRLVKHAIIEAIQPVTQSVQQVQKQLYRDSFRRWLAPPDPFLNYNNAIKIRQDGTGRWLLQDTRYQQWRESENTVLWLSGLPGCGKTILSSIVLEDLQINPEHRHDSIMLMFYFDFSDGQKQSLDSAIRSLITQLCDHNPDISQMGQDLFAQYQSGSKAPTTRALLDTFAKMLRACSVVYIVIDAIDECPHSSTNKARREVLKWISSLYQSKIPSVHLLVTSRPEQDIQDELSSHVPENFRVSLDTELVQADIDAYIHYQVHRHQGLIRWHSKKSLQEDIQRTLSQKSNGMFRWVALQIEEIQACRTEHHVREALASLPDTLHDTYSRIIRMLPSRTRDDALRLLQFLVYCDRPLSIGEAIEAIAVQFHPQPHFSPDRLYRGSDDLVYICSSLVSVRIGEHGRHHVKRTERFIQLSHFSVREYFLSSQLPPEIAAMFTEVAGHTTIAKVCIIYLINKGNDSGPMSKNPIALHSFCLRNWTRYARQADADPQMQKLATTFYMEGNRTYRRALQEFMPDAYGDYFEDWEGSALYYASYSGQLNICKMMIARGEAVNARGGYYGTALIAAVEGRHEQVVRLLLYHQADANAGPSGQSSALQGAFFRGDKQIVRLLLDHQADINAQGGIYGPVLYMASARNDQDSVRLLLDRQADVNVSGGHYGTSLHVAPGWGHERIVRLLLEHRANVNAQGGRDSTALQLASSEGHEHIVRLLLDNGADPNIHGDYYTALHEASEHGYEHIVRMLLDANADPNIRGYYGTALEKAAAKGHENIVRLLLEYQADPNIDGEGGTPLLMASNSGNEQIVRLLLDYQADPNINGRYGTALEVAARRGHENLVQLLLSSQADPDIVGLNGTALQEASRRGFEQIAQLLLDKGANSDVQGQHGTALHLASESGHEQMVRLLLDCRANPSIKVKRGIALDTAMAMGHRRIVRMLLEHQPKKTAA